MSADALRALFAARMAEAGPGPFGLAVSGGGDSMALLALASAWAGAQPGASLAVVTVDHGLRAAAAGEALSVARRAAALGLSHDTLRWDGGDGTGNLAEAAREARRALIAAWARARGIGTVLLGHTMDDQAETVLLRLARGSGVGGLAAMAWESEGAGIRWLRPLLSVRREDLRAHLDAIGWHWVEDPTNADLAHDRPKARAMLGLLGDLGLTVERLATTARHMAEAREVLDAAEGALAREALAWSPEGEARVALLPLAAAPRAVATQFLADLLAAVAGARHPPRLDGVERLHARALAGEEGGTSLHGVVARVEPGRLRLRREPARVAPPVPAADGAEWDGRWRLSSDVAVPGGAEIGALGLDGLALVERRPDQPAEVLRTTPAVRAGGLLLAAPLAGFGAGWRAARVISDPRRRRLLAPR